MGPICQNVMVDIQLKKSCFTTGLGALSFTWNLFPLPQVNMYYSGRLQNGTQFDSCTSGKPFKFRLGKQEVIKGWDIGIAGESLNDGGTRSEALVQIKQQDPPTLTQILYTLCNNFSEFYPILVIFDSHAMQCESM